MKAFLTSTYNYKDYSPAKWLKSKSTSQNCTCIDNGEDADVIIFVESHPTIDPYFRKLFRDKTYLAYKRKCVLYHDADLSITPLPTISPSIERWQYNPKHKRSAHYIARYRENKTIDNALINYNNSRKYLYSFIGSKTHAVRNAIINIAPRQDVYIKDTTGSQAWELNVEEALKYEREYLEVMDESYFILCPRGIGPSTYRLFEAMQLGRVPVIISDSWVEILGVDWDSFSIRIPQSKVSQIEQILQDRKEEAVAMGKQAREAWEKNFSPEVSLDRIVGAAIELIKNEYSYYDSIKDYLQFLQDPFHFKNLLRYKKNKLRRKYKL
ncbi:exostosin domain-containing protein [Segetibacter aerophilus]|uniref:Exostosin GT47 domain-containing protein n=1 Tax=Segetibacter aerophilus TaxID=670293 RepID=A0A512BAX8_9BACT|nr:exostosin family protein [Segetibacter aerophilus]GEO09126.1 hypothetical protein SAE01_16220 [Segetibacter aerophilus]